MQENETPIAVTSRSFSQHPVLREELLARYHNVLFNDTGKQIPYEHLPAFLCGRKKIIVALEKLDHSIIEKLPDLKVISKYGVGLNNLDLAALSHFDVKIGWTAGVNRLSVAELTILFMLSLVRKFSQSHRLASGGGWQQIIGGQLTGKTIGLIGVGHVGKEVVRLLQPFRCKILANDIAVDHHFFKENNLIASSKDDLLTKSDLISLHVPLSSETRQMLNFDKMSLMKSHAFLVNTSRGDIVCEKTLKEFLKSGKIAGAAFDVFAEEPPSDLELLSMNEFICTPHIGGSSEEAILAMGRAAIEGLHNYKDASDYKAYQ